MAEVLLYGTVYSDSAKDFIEDLNEASSDNNVTVRVNGDGGEVKYAWGIITKLSQIEKVKLINDGEANSMLAFAFCYGKDNEAADYASFVFHRCGYASWIESSPEYFTDADKTELAEKNKFLRKALEGRVNVPVFEKITGATLNQLFSLDQRIDVKLSAKQAKECGLIDRIIQVTPKRRNDIQALTAKIEARYSKKIAAITEIKTNTNMDASTLKTEHPAVYAQIFDLGKAAGLEQEKDRVEACLTFIEADPKGVAEAIASGKALSQKQMAEFALKVMSGSTLKDLEKESADPIKTKEVKDEKAKATAELEAFKAEVIKNSTFLSAK